MRKRIVMFVMLCSCYVASAQKKYDYKEMAGSTFFSVWEKYRVLEYGLFSEYYPSSHKPDLTYFQDGTKQANEVSYLWPMSGVFSSVVLLAELDKECYSPYLDSMVIAVEQYRDTTRKPEGYQAYPSRFGVVDRYYDDNGLVGIDYIDAYEVTKNPLYLQRAKEVMTFIESGWSDRFGGGVTWLEGVRDQKPACSNGKAMILALKLYKATKEQHYLEYGMKTYVWMNTMLRDDSLNIVWNSLLYSDGDSCSVQKHAYTYNTGTLIQAAVMLYEITGSNKFLEDAQMTAKGSFDFYFERNAKDILKIKNMAWFNVVLLRGYMDLYAIDGVDTYVKAFKECVDWAWIHARGKKGLSYDDWTGEADERKTPKWLLNTSCLIEVYVRMYNLENK